MTESYSTILHEKDWDNVSCDSSFEKEEVVSATHNNSKNFYYVKMNFRFIRKQIFNFIKKFQKDENNVIILVTNGEIPIDFVAEYRKQYPDKIIKILIPIDNYSGLEKLDYDVEFFLKNKTNNAALYHLKPNSENVEVFGLYSESFSNKDRTRLEFLAPFVRATREVIKKLKPQIVHSFEIPFFLGVEFDKKFVPSLKVIQSVNDFSTFEDNKNELFWAAINLADKKAMKKICNDNIIKKCIASLFNFHNLNDFSRMEECLEFLYDNYSKFRSFVNKDEKIEENFIFNRMNSRILKIFPQMSCGNEAYNLIYHTIKRVDFWTVFSETYYNKIFESDNNLSESMSKRLIDTKSKSDWIQLGYTKKSALIYQKFNSENFRERRIRNKNYIVKELTKDRISTKFIDLNLFSEHEYIVKGYLDKIDNAALIFCNFHNIYIEGADIALTALLKFLEEYKNIQIIINIPNGLKEKSISSWIDFMESKPLFNGRWVYIDTPVNLEQFYSAADITLFPIKKNIALTTPFIALNQGCVPIASKIGIFNDIITDIFDDMTNGCGFKTKTDSDIEFLADFVTTFEKGLNLYTKNHSCWNLLIKNAINNNFDWDFEKLEKYNRIYKLF